MAPVAGTDAAEASSGDWSRGDLFLPSAGDDTLAGGGGDDLYLYGPGAGHDRVVDDGWADAADRLALGAGLSSADASVTREGADAKLRFAGRDGSVTLVNSFREDAHGVDRVQFADGAV